MAQKAIQIGTTFISFNDTNFKLEGSFADAGITITRISDNALIVRAYSDKIIVWNELPPTNSMVAIGTLTHIPISGTFDSTLKAVQIANSVITYNPSLYNLIDNYGNPEGNFIIIRIADSIEMIRLYNRETAFWTTVIAPGSLIVRGNLTQMPLP